MLGGLVSYLRYMCMLWCFVFLRLVYHMLPVSLDCPFLIATLVISKIHWLSAKYIVT
jgi:hypothetical protein